MRLVPRRLVACRLVLLLGVLGPGVAHGSGGGPNRPSQPCRHGDRGRLLGFERVASHPTAADAQAYSEAWVEFYRDYCQFPPDITADIDHVTVTSWVRAMPRAAEHFRTLR